MSSKPYGKRKCDVLRDIRKSIAEANDLPVSFAVCDHEGNCPGTCPRCDAELEELNRLMALKQDAVIPEYADGCRISEKADPRESAIPDAPYPETTMGLPFEPEPPKKKSFFARIIDRIFHR